MAVVALASAFGIFLFASPARAQTTSATGSSASASSGGSSSGGSSSTISPRVYPLLHTSPPALGYSGVQAPATPSSLDGVKAVPPAETNPVLHEGQQLFAVNCSSCHGLNAAGSSRGPNLLGLGSATVDFWVSTGRMPLAKASAQATEKPPRFDYQQAAAIAEYVNSLDPGGPQIPTVDTKTADIEEGFKLFSLNCAPCHTIVGAGDALTDGTYAPSLMPAKAFQVVEALRTGPGQMPRFGPGVISDQQAADIAAYVEYLHHPEDRGGLSIGKVGPVAEGFVAIIVGLGGLMMVIFWIGDRA
jgi:ubiquinol-cytochrome c reductase cytochrome c subunit